MMEKLQRSQKAVEHYMKEQAHKNMLVQEQRKLQDEDMKKVHMRAKRLATKKKYQILEKEDNDKKKRKYKSKHIELYLNSGGS
jgi:hypothetical protein